VAMGCVRVAAAHEDTVGLGDLMGDITVEKLASSQTADKTTLTEERA